MITSLLVCTVLATITDIKQIQIDTREKRRRRKKEDSLILDLVKSGRLFSTWPTNKKMSPVLAPSILVRKTRDQMKVAKPYKSKGKGFRCRSQDHKVLTRNMDTQSEVTCQVAFALLKQKVSSFDWFVLLLTKFKDISFASWASFRFIFQIIPSIHCSWNIFFLVIFPVIEHTGIKTPY